MSKPMDNISNITLLADMNGSACSISPEQMLEQELIKVRDGRRRGTKAFVVFLDDSMDCYDIGWGNSGMRMSEIISLIEVLKIELAGEMGYPSK